MQTHKIRMDADMRGLATYGTREIFYSVVKAFEAACCLNVFEHMFTCMWPVLKEHIACACAVVKVWHVLINGTCFVEAHWMCSTTWPYTGIWPRTSDK
jgi:hypothetical protein